jgi:hypothetical protein
MSYLRARTSLPSAPIRNTVAVFPPRAWSKRTGDQDATRGIENEGARMCGPNVCVFNGDRLAGLLVDAKHRDVALPRAEDRLAVDVFSLQAPAALATRLPPCTDRVQECYVSSHS